MKHMGSWNEAGLTWQSTMPWKESAMMDETQGALLPQATWEILWEPQKCCQFGVCEKNMVRKGFDFLCGGSCGWSTHFCCASTCEWKSLLHQPSSMLPWPLSTLLLTHCNLQCLESQQIQHKQRHRNYTCRKEHGCRDEWWSTPTCMATNSAWLLKCILAIGT